LLWKVNGIATPIAIAKTINRVVTVNARVSVTSPAGAAEFNFMISR
jgi:hypothetical protein